MGQTYDDGARDATSVDPVARMMFLGNPDDAAVTISMSSEQSALGLFLFCLDLMMRGLLLTCRGGMHPVPVHDICEDQFALVARKMACAGIQVRKTTREIPMGASSVNLDEVMRMPPDLPLPSYLLWVANRGIMHGISFEIVRNMRDTTCHGDGCRRLS
jgi:hypothetical protein